MSSDDKRGDAVADAQRERFAKGRRESDLALTELEVRAEMKSMGEDETTDVIQREALERQKKKGSDPPSQRGPWAILTIPLRIKSWPQVVGFGIAALLVAVLVKWGLKLF